MCVCVCVCVRVCTCTPVDGACGCLGTKRVPPPPRARTPGILNTCLVYLGPIPPQGTDPVEEDTVPVFPECALPPVTGSPTSEGPVFGVAKCGGRYYWPWKISHLLLCVVWL